MQTGEEMLEGKVTEGKLTEGKVIEGKTIEGKVTHAAPLQQGNEPATRGRDRGKGIPFVACPPIHGMRVMVIAGTPNVSLLLLTKTSRHLVLRRRWD